MNTGDRIHFEIPPCTPIPKGYQADGVIIRVFEVGDLISRDNLREFVGHYRMLGPSRVRRVIMKRDNGSYIWIPDIWLTKEHITIIKEKE